MPRGRRNNPMPEADRQQVEVEERPQRERNTRVPMHQRDLLTVHGKDPDRYYRWCLDVDNKIMRYMQAGYEFVSDPALSIGEMSVNPTTQTGEVVSKKSGERTLYLMSIDREFYEQDQRAKAIEVDEMEKTMYAQTNSNEDLDHGEGMSLQNDMLRTRL